MKKIFVFLFLSCTALTSSFFYTNTGQSPVDKLYGSYTNLPEELKDFSQLDGAVALETKFLYRLYNKTVTDKIVTQQSRSLIRSLFYQIPTTNDFGLSKKIFENKEKKEIKTIIKKIINNLVYRFILENCKKGTHTIYKGIDTKTYKNIIRIIEKKILPIAPIPRESFLQASPEIYRLTLLGSLWFIQKNIQSFNYENLLKKIVIKSCDTITADLTTNTNKTNANNGLVRFIREKIAEIKKAAQSIQKPKTILNKFKKQSRRSFPEKR